MIQCSDFNQPVETRRIFCQDAATPASEKTPPNLLDFGSPTIKGRIEFGLQECQIPGILILKDLESFSHEGPSQFVGSELVVAQFELALS
jgi:hypothetical protein